MMWHVYQNSLKVQLFLIALSLVRTQHVLKLIISDRYPLITGQACFVCESNLAGGDATRETTLDTCRMCQNMSLTALSAPALVTHMGAHILHDPRLSGADNPCGFCLNTGTLCSVRLTVTSKNTVIDMKGSRCPHLRKLALAPAAAFNPPSSPCTNHPLVCPLCTERASGTVPAVWKYNLHSHITTVHPRADINLYKDLYEISEAERLLMMRAFKVKPRRVKRAQGAPLAISDAHSTRVSLRYDLF